MCLRDDFDALETPALLSMNPNTCMGILIFVMKHPLNTDCVVNLRRSWQCVVVDGLFGNPAGTDAVGFLYKQVLKHICSEYQLQR